MSILPGDNDQTGINNNLRTTVGFVIGKSAKPIQDLWNDYTEWKSWNIMVTTETATLVDCQDSFYKRVGNIVELLVNFQVYPNSNTSLTLTSLPFPPVTGVKYAGPLQLIRIYTDPFDSDGMVEIDPSVSLTDFTVRIATADDGNLEYSSTSPVTMRGRIRYQTPVDSPLFLTYLPSE